MPPAAGERREKRAKKGASSRVHKGEREKEGKEGIGALYTRGLVCISAYKRRERTTKEECFLDARGARENEERIERARDLARAREESWSSDRLALVSNARALRLA